MIVITPVEALESFSKTFTIAGYENDDNWNAKIDAADTVDGVAGDAADVAGNALYDAAEAAKNNTFPGFES